MYQWRRLGYPSVSQMPSLNFSVPFSGVRTGGGGGWGVKTSPLMIEKNKNLFFWNDPPFFVQRFLKLLPCFSVLSNLLINLEKLSLRYKNSYSQTFLVGCANALEPTTNSKCKPGQSQWLLLKLESCCDVIKPLFYRAVMAGQHNVPAQEVFLEENGFNAGRCSACDVIILSYSNQPVRVNHRHRYRRGRFWVQFLGRYFDNKLCFKEQSSLH